ncbi:HPP family protein [Flagellimonas alvinocaridis]|uniref:HPP family protein n=1 Tax=Flagellimonas alvinocaridis TaxID=2530200 RepID=A0A4V4HX37_9FLAO|nr:HPP family protein [Allomuricauda alvinocaridis]THV59516.1 HPP family protein [Allomuricauda alvinocaridis]
MRNNFRRGYRIGRYIVYRETSLNPKELFWSFLGSFIGIACIGVIQGHYLNQTDNILIIGSFGATGVLIYGAIHSPLAQPRNLIGGHVISAIIGVTVSQFLGDILWLAAALSVSISILAMQLSKTLHPPGGATALIAVIGSEKIIGLGYWYVIFPVLSGVFIMLLVALTFNNLTPERRYPANGRFLRLIRLVAKPALNTVNRMKKAS